MSVREALEFYADPDNYAKQPVMAETLGGWIPEEIPEDQRDDYVALAMRNAIDDQPFGAQFMEPNSEGAIHHAVSEPRMWGQIPALVDDGERAREALSALHEQVWLGEAVRSGVTVRDALEKIAACVRRYADTAYGCRCNCGAKADNGKPWDHACIDHDEHLGGALDAIDELDKALAALRALGLDPEGGSDA